MAPPPPSVPTTRTTNVVSFNATIANECSAFDEPKRTVYKERLAATLPWVEPSDIVLRVTCASLRVEAFIIARSTAEADQVRVALTTTVADAGAASLSLGFQVLSVSKVVFAPMMSFSPPIPPSVEEPSTGTPPPSPNSS